LGSELRGLSVWLVVDPSDSELAVLPDRFCEAGALTVCESLAAAEALSAAEAPPDWLVLGTSVPGQLDTAALARLRAWAPLARVWQVAGSWCEGETRSGKVLPGVVRCGWLEADLRLARGAAAASLAALPATATPEEHLLALSARPVGRRQGLVAVCSGERETAAALVEACRRRGYATARVEPHGNADLRGVLALVWDTTARQAGDRAAVAALRVQTGQAPVLAVLGFPRVDECAAARQAGVAAVLAKPWLLGDLYGWLDQQPAGH
jgi:CheY-like chemotaxis protein